MLFKLKKKKGLLCLSAQKSGALHGTDRQWFWNKTVKQYQRLSSPCPESVDGVEEQRRRKTKVTGMRRGQGPKSKNWDLGGETETTDGDCLLWAWPLVLPAQHLPAFLLLAVRADVKGLRFCSRDSQGARQLQKTQLEGEGLRTLDFSGPEQGKLLTGPGKWTACYRVERKNRTSNAWRQSWQKTSLDALPSWRGLPCWCVLLLFLHTCKIPSGEFSRLLTHCQRDI